MDDTNVDDCDLGDETGLETWLALASRDELVQRIRENEARERQRYGAFAPALKWLARRVGDASEHAAEVRGVKSRFDPFDPYSVVAVLLEMGQQSERVARADDAVMRFLSDYRPDLIAQIIALRRNNLTRMTNDWPQAALAAYLHEETGIAAAERGCQHVTEIVVGIHE